MHDIVPITSQAAKAVYFGPFCLLPAQQLLMEGNRPVAIGARALSILMVLVDHAGEVVGKDDLVARVWPDIFVEESNLRVHVAGLRRALRDGQGGNRYVVNVPGRGYSFVAPVEVRDPVSAVSSPPPLPDRPAMLPPVLTRVIGRSSVVAALCTHLAQRRFVTLVGPGGIGKTTVAVAVARELAPSYRDGVGFVDFASIGSPNLVPTILAGALGLAVPSEDAVPAVISFLRQKQMLLVLDSCEHVIEAAASAAEEISSGAPGVHILATSREPLRAAGERVHRLQPLEGPPASDGLTAAEAMTFPCIQLFIERASSTLDNFELSDADAPFAAEICRRLDGIALAIELAAGRVAAFGIRGLSARLDDRFALLTSGRRTALPRHQTLAATLDWSYELLPETGRALLRRLSVFAGGFTLEAASALFGPFPELQTAAEIAELVSKSLVVAEFGAESVRYRLLDTTRLYGLEKLRQSQELEQARGAHAAYFRTLFAEAEAACETLPQGEWLAIYAAQLDNVRAALDWAESAGGDRDICVALTIGAVPLWVQLSLMSECRLRVERALECLAGEGGEDAAVARSRMRLCAARGWALMYSAGRSGEIGAAWATTLDLARRLGDPSYQLRALWGVWISEVNKGDFAAALHLARQLLDLVRDSSDVLDLMMAERLLATTLHYRGDQGEARAHIDRMLARYATIGRQPRVARFQVDQRVTAHYFKARILWLQGFPDQARRLAESNIEDGLALGHALSFGSILGQGACPIALFNGDLEGAQRFAEMLLDHAEKHGLRLWYDWARCFEGLLLARSGDLAAGLEIMEAAFDKAADARFLPRYMLLLGEFAACLGQAGQLARGLEMIDGILARCDRSEERWYVPELLRNKGELLRLTGTADAEMAAEACFHQGLSLAQTQDSRSWQLRCATSLARLRRDQGRAEEGRSHLASVLRSFDEGTGTFDLRTARQIVDAA